MPYVGEVSFPFNSIGPLIYTYKQEPRHVKENASRICEQPKP